MLRGVRWFKAVKTRLRGGNEHWVRASLNGRLWGDRSWGWCIDTFQTEWTMWVKAGWGTREAAIYWEKHATLLLWWEQREHDKPGKVNPGLNWGRPLNAKLRSLHLIEISSKLPLKISEQKSGLLRVMLWKMSSMRERQEIQSRKNTLNSSGMTR